MSSLVRGNFTRATTFFALAFGCMLIGGVLLGVPRIGVQWGFVLGVAFAIFAYFFLKPTDVRTDGPESDP